MPGDLAHTLVRPASDLRRRIAVTVGAVALLLVGRRVHLPFLDEDALRMFAGDPLRYGLSPLTLGLRPLVTSFLLVEIVAQVHPRLRDLRHGSRRDRLPLTRAAWIVALGLASWQGWALAAMLQGQRGALGLPLVAQPGLASILGITAAFVLGTVVVGWAAVLVSRHGVGNGFAVLLAVGAVEAVVGVGRSALRVPRELWSDAVVLVAIALALVIPLVVAHRRKPEQPEPAAPPCVPVPTCGLVVIEGPGVVFSFPAKLALWLSPAVPLAKLLDETSWLNTFLDLALIAALALLFARWFFPPAAVVEAFRRGSPQGLDGDAESGVRRALAAANRRSVGLVMGVALVPLAAELLGAPVVPSFDVLLEIAVAIAVALDLAAEAKARAGGQALVAVRAIHRAYAVEPTLRALAAAGIAALPRARAYRTLFQLFAPWAPVEILVPPERGEEAEAICARVATSVAG